MSAIRKSEISIVEFETREIGIRNIEILTDQLQSRAKINMDVVRTYSEYMRDGANFPPVVVFFTPDERYLLADGFHRVKAWQKLRKQSIKCVVRKGTMTDALLFGIETNLNLIQNKPNDDDRQHAAALMIRDEVTRQWSNKEIARRCGVGTGVIRRIRLDLRDNEGMEIPQRVIAFRDGKSTAKMIPYTQNTNRLPPKPTKAGYYMVRIGGKRLTLGPDREKAEARYKQLLFDRDSKKAHVTTIKGLKEFLTTRYVYVSSRPSQTFGGIVVGGTHIFMLHGPKFEDILATVGRAVLARIEDGFNPMLGSSSATRTIIVWHSGISFDGKASCVIKFAKQLSPPIEFMTPEEVVAEFGPKDENGNPAEASPADIDS